MKNCIKLFCRLFVAGALVAPALTSCYDDQPLWDKLNSLEAKVDSLVNDLNSQAEALSALMTDGSTIASCTKNDDGSYLVKLSDGTEFTVLSKNADASALVSVVEVEGVRCWATYGADGELVALRDAAGKTIPVDLAVSVSIKDGKYCLVIGGNEYETGYDAEDVVSVFSSCTPHTDASGQVYAVTFTLGDGIEVTVTVDGYKGVMFKLSNAGSNKPVAEYYVDFGTTQTFLMELDDVVDYVMQIPDGWRVNEYVDELSGETYVDITAPSEETIAAGAAVASGDLKVVSVVEGGKATVTKLVLSTDPFKTYNISATKAVFEPFTGIQKIVYGVFDYDAYDKATVLSTVSTILTSSSDLPAGYHVAETAVDKTLEDIYGKEMSETGEYVFWVVPALYSEGTDGTDGGFYVVEEMLREKVMAPISAKVSVSNIGVISADMSLRVVGTTSIYAGVALKSDTLLEEIAYMLNNGGLDPMTEGLMYNGPVSEFPTKDSALELDPNTSYVVWVVPVEPGKTSYAAADIIYNEFKTLDVVSGGSQKVTIGAFSADASSMSAPLSSADAAMIYYAFLTDKEASRLVDDASKLSKMMASSNFNMVRGESAVAALDNIKPETKMWLFAVAVAADGKYGAVASASATTATVSFNSLTVAVDDPVVTAKDVKFTISVSGGTAVDYIYWCGKETDPFWLYEEYCASNVTDAENFMAANPDTDQITSFMKKHGQIATDGTLVISDLDINTTYVFVVLAKDANGLYSKAGYKKFNTPAADLGDMVMSDSNTWRSAKQWIESNIVWDQKAFSASSGNGQGFASYAFDIKIPVELTAFVSCFSTVATEVDEVILEVIELCSARRDVSVIVDDPEGLEWVDDNGKEHNASMYFNVCEYYVHGAPDYGYVTYFAQGEGHQESSCPTWESGQCTNYEYARMKITDKLSLDYWIGWVNDNCNYVYNNDPQHEYSYALTDETKINALAQAFVDAYAPYYKDKEPILYVNDGAGVRVLNRTAMGLDESGNVVDKVIVVLKDASGNYYEPMYINVPNYFY